MGASLIVLWLNKELAGIWWLMDSPEPPVDMW
jgi:hypothetical protein